MGFPEGCGFGNSPLRYRFWPQLYRLVVPAVRRGGASWCVEEVYAGVPGKPVVLEENRPRTEIWLMLQSGDLLPPKRSAGRLVVTTEPSTWLLVLAPLHRHNYTSKGHSRRIPRSALMEIEHAATRKRRHAEPRAPGIYICFPLVFGFLELLIQPTSCRQLPVTAESNRLPGLTSGPATKTQGGAPCCNTRT